MTTPKFAPAPRTPQKSSLFSSWSGADLPAVGRGQLDTQQVVDSKPVSALQAAHPAAECKASHPGVPDHPDRAGESESLRRLVELAEVRAAAHLGNSSLRIDRHALDRSEVQNHPAVAGGESGRAVPAAPHGDRQLILTCEPERGDDVRCAAAASDAGRISIEDAIPNDPGLVVAGIAGQNHSAFERFEEGSERRAIQVAVWFLHGHPQPDEPPASLNPIRL